MTINDPSNSKHGEKWENCWPFGALKTESLARWNLMEKKITPTRPVYAGESRPSPNISLGT